jgi:hypothetical protein
VTKRLLFVPTLAAVLMCSPAYATSITNGSFETGDFTGWTLTGNTGFGTEVCKAGDTFLGSVCSAESGSFAAVVGPNTNPEFISQSLSTTPGDDYSLTFFLRNDNLGLPPGNSFQVLWGGATEYSITNIGQQAYTQVTLSNLVASSASTLLSFKVVNDPGGFYLDNVSIKTVPEPATFLLFGMGLLLVASGRRSSRWSRLI